jgi:hypothetical protein
MTSDGNVIGTRTIHEVVIIVMTQSLGNASISEVETIIMQTLSETESFFG